MDTKKKGSTYADEVAGRPIQYWLFGMENVCFYEK